MPHAIDRHIRVSPEQWKRIESAAESTNQTANQLVIKLAIEALDHREWPRNPHEIRLLRSSIFAAQILARELIDAGRADELEEIRRDMSQLARELPDESPSQEPRGADSTDAADDSSRLFSE